MVVVVVVVVVVVGVVGSVYGSVDGSKWLWFMRDSIFDCIQMEN